MASRYINRTYFIVAGLSLLGALILGFGQACGKSGQSILATRVRAPKPLPPPASLNAFQPPLAPHLVCKMFLNSAPTVFRTIDSQPAKEVFDSRVLPKEDENFTIDCRNTTSGVVDNVNKLEFKIEFHDSDFLPLDLKSTLKKDTAPIFNYAVKNGTYVGTITATDTLGLKSSRDFLLQVSCNNTQPITLNMNKLIIKPVPELDRTAADQNRATGDRYEYNPRDPNSPSDITKSIVVLPPGSPANELDKYVYSFDFNGDGLFDPYKDGRIFKSWSEMQENFDDNDGVVEEGDGNPFNSVFSYFRGKCTLIDDTSSPGNKTCEKNANKIPVINTNKRVGVRVLDSVCNVYQEGFIDYNFGVDENNQPSLQATPTPAVPITDQPFYEVAGMFPNQLFAIYLVADWLPIRNPANGVMNDDKRIDNIHYVGVTPLKERLSNSDRFLFRFNRGIGFTGQPRHLSTVSMLGSTKYFSEENRGTHGMQVGLLYQDLTVASESLLIKAKMCKGGETAYDPLNPRIITPCIQFVNVSGASMSETSGLYGTDIRYAPSDTNSCEVEYQIVRTEPGAAACLLSGGVIDIFPSGLLPQNITVREGKVVEWVNNNTAGAVQGTLKIYRQGATPTDLTEVFSKTIAVGAREIPPESLFANPATFKYEWISSITAPNPRVGFVSVIEDTTTNPNSSPTPTPTPVPQGGLIDLEISGQLPTKTTQKGFKINFKNIATASSGEGILRVYSATKRTQAGQLLSDGLDLDTQGNIKLTQIASPLTPTVFDIRIGPTATAEFLFNTPGVYKYTWSPNTSDADGGYIAVLDTFVRNQPRPFSMQIDGKIKCTSLDNGAVEPEGGTIKLEDAAPTPRDLSTKKGFKVIWTNSNTVGAFGTLKLFEADSTVTGGFKPFLVNGAAFERGISINSSTDFTFTVPKLYKYTWTIGSQTMEGTINVVDALPTNQRRFMKFESGRFNLRVGESEKGICGEPGPGPGDDGPPPKEPPAL
ncbi:MAG: hypothetical protein SGI74_04155 [Oligoflexia bacterium]|nr:hypothetical protein [Oligoflexia bacterium]